MRGVYEMKWRFIKTGADGNCELFGANIFMYKWEDTGEKVTVKDPIYKKSYEFNVWKISINMIEHKFVAGEFSSCVWGFYLPKV
jgi:hypothetical protein